MTICGEVLQASRRCNWDSAITIRLQNVLLFFSKCNSHSYINSIYIVAKW